MGSSQRMEGGGVIGMIGMTTKKGRDALRLGSVLCWAECR